LLYRLKLNSYSFNNVSYEAVFRLFESLKLTNTIGSILLYVISEIVKQDRHRHTVHAYTEKKVLNSTNILFKTSLDLSVTKLELAPSFFSSKDYEDSVDGNQ
jgi:hypothetical protein